MGDAHTWIPRGLGVVAFVLYVVAAPSGWYWLDAGELSAAAVGLGSPHPTGFPLYVVLAKAATFVPLGELAFRINLLSALCGALTVAFIARLVCDAGGTDAATAAGAVAAGAALALSLTLFRQATIAEIYAPTAALMAIALVLFARVARGAGASAGLMLAFVAGLGLAVHGSFRLLLGIPIVLLLCVCVCRGARWPLVTPALTVVIALALHAYLPLRSASGSATHVDWGHPRTAAALVDHAWSATRIRAAYGDEMFAQGQAARAHMRLFGAQVLDHLGPLLLLAAAAGALWLGIRRRQRWLAFVLAIIVLGDTAYAVWVNPMGIADQQTGLSLALGLACLAGLGVAWLARVTAAAAPFVGGVAAVVLVTPLALSDDARRWAARHGAATRAFIEGGIQSLPPGAVVIAQRDDFAAGALFVTVAEQMRPDVAVLVRQHIWDIQRNRDVLSRAGIDDIEPDAVLPALVRTQRTVAWEPGASPPPGNAQWRVGTPLGRLVGPGTSLGDEVRAARELRERVFGERDAGDPFAQRAHAVAIVSLGLAAYRVGRGDTAAALYRAALSVRPDHPAALVNLGVLEARRGRMEIAVALTERAIIAAPVHVSARVNAARFCLRLNEDARAAAHVRAAVRIEPRRADAWALIGILHARAGQLASAVRSLRWALLLDPGNRDARSTLTRLRRAGSKMSPTGNQRSERAWD